jgi:hypothetical protein
VGAEGEEFGRQARAALGDRAFEIGNAVVGSLERGCEGGQGRPLAMNRPGPSSSMMSPAKIRVIGSAWALTGHHKPAAASMANKMLPAVNRKFRLILKFPVSVRTSIPVQGHSGVHRRGAGR